MQICANFYNLFYFWVVRYKKSLNDWSLGKQLILFPSNLNVSLGSASGNKINCFPLDQSLSVYKSRGNHENKLKPYLDRLWFQRTGLEFWEHDRLPNVLFSDLFSKEKQYTHKNEYLSPILNIDLKNLFGGWLFRINNLFLDFRVGFLGKIREWIPDQFKISRKIQLGIFFTLPWNCEFTNGVICLHLSPWGDFYDGGGGGGGAGGGCTQAMNGATNHCHLRLKSGY